MNTSQFKKDPLDRLFCRMKTGDRRAAADIYDKLLPSVYDFFILQTAEISAAEDLSEKIFLTLIEAVAEFNEKETSATIWFWQLAHDTVAHYNTERTETEALVAG